MSIQAGLVCKHMATLGTLSLSELSRFFYISIMFALDWPGCGMQSCTELLTTLLESKDYNKGNVKGTKF
jgi:hypothetical protein